MRCIARSAATLLLLLLFVLSTSAAETPRAKPDDVGISAQRLQRIHELMQRHIDAGDFSGSVTLVARKLQEGGLIRYRRGHIQVLDVEGLHDSCCECYAAINAHFRRLVGWSPDGAVGDQRAAN